MSQKGKYCHVSAFSALDKYFWKQIFCWKDV